MRRIYDIVQILLIICIGALVLGVGAARFIFNITPHIVLSGSMEPTIPTGSLCFVDEGMKTPKKGDIIAFSKGKILVTHRVVAMNGERYTTKGDHNNVTDPAPVYSKDLLGTNIFWIPLAGYAVAFLQSQRGIVLTITVFFVFLLIGSMLPEERRRNASAEN